MAEGRPEEKVVHEKNSIHILRVALVCAVNVDVRFLNNFLSQKMSDKVVLFSGAVILVIKNWPFVISCQRNKRKLRFIFADY